jgi:hypothetical protein
LNRIALQSLGRLDADGIHCITFAVGAACYGIVYVGHFARIEGPGIAAKYQNDYYSSDKKNLGPLAQLRNVAMKSTGNDWNGCKGTMTNGRKKREYN